MALGDFTRQLAQEAIGNQVKDVLDALRPPDLSRIAGTLPADKPAVAGPQDHTGAVILKQVEAMQNALKENEELVVLFHSGVETLRVLDFFVPSPQVIVLAGIDTDRNITRAISPAESLQLVCKVMKLQPEAKPVRVRVLRPAPKSP